jgi:hypothetical protein
MLSPFDVTNQHRLITYQLPLVERRWRQIDMPTWVPRLVTMQSAPQLLAKPCCRCRRCWMSTRACAYCYNLLNPQCWFSPSKSIRICDRACGHLARKQSNCFADTRIHRATIHVLTFSLAVLFATHALNMKIIRSSRCTIHAPHVSLRRRANLV